MRGKARQTKAEQATAPLISAGEPGGRRHVVDAEQIEARQQAAEHGSGGVPAVEEAQPGDAAWSGLHPPRNGRKRGPHQHGGRQQADRADQARAAGCPAGRGPLRRRKAALHVEPRTGPGYRRRRSPAPAPRRRAAGATAGRSRRGSRRLPRHSPPMKVPSSTPRETAGGADHQFQQLVPDDFVDQRRTAAGHKEDHQPRQEPVQRRRGGGRAKFVFSHAKVQSRRRPEAATISFCGRSLTVAVLCQAAHRTASVSERTNFTHTPDPRRDYRRFAVRTPLPRTVLYNQDWVSDARSGRKPTFLLADEL